MGTIYKRGGTWWVGFKGPKRWEYKSTGKPITESIEKIRKLLREIEAAERAAPNTVAAPRTVSEFAEQWTAKRRTTRKLWNAEKDLAVLKIHVLPRIGHLRLRDVTALQIRELVASLNSTRTASRSILSTYGLVRRMFSDAVAAGLVDSSPCVLERGDLPRKVDKEIGWRETAKFTREEAERLLFDEKVPLDRRVTYGLGILGGLREGEISALRWGSVDLTLKPLGCILVVASYTRSNGREKTPKTGRAREVPVHPMLVQTLIEWGERGFFDLFGRQPEPGDLFVPNREGDYRTDNSFFKGLKYDLNRLGMRRRRFHDTRRTCITLGRADGANPDVLRTVTHDQVGDVFDQYTSFDWSAKCAAVAAIKIQRPAKVLKRKKASGGGPTAFTTVNETEAQSMETMQENKWARGDSNSPSVPFTGAQIYTFQRLEGGKPTLRRSGESAKRSNVVSELEAATAAFKAEKNPTALAARLRIILAKLRGGK